jgi:hypothetical protein
LVYEEKYILSAFKLGPAPYSVNIHFLKICGLQQAIEEARAHGFNAKTIVKTDHPSLRYKPKRNGLVCRRAFSVDELFEHLLVHVP